MTKSVICDTMVKEDKVPKYQVLLVLVRVVFKILDLRLKKVLHLDKLLNFLI